MKAAQALKSLPAITSVQVGSGCACRDKPSFKVLRHLPLQHLAFGHGSVVSAAYLLEIISGDKKLASLTSLQLDNVYADLGEVQELSWRDQSSELSGWFQGGYTLPEWLQDVLARRPRPARLSGEGQRRRALGGRDRGARH